MPKIFRTAAALAAGTAALALAAPAQADWKTVETKNFIYHSEDSLENIKENVTHLETLDTLVRAITGNKKEPGIAKVRIFEVQDMAMLNRLVGSPGGLGGFYTNNDMGPYLFTFRQAISRNQSAFKTESSQQVWGPQVRQHEYLHHYMYQYFNANYPSWYSEGFAEYYGSTTFPEENVVEMGHPPMFRLESLRNNKWVPVSKLLTARSYDEIGADNLGAIYAQGWLLTHMAARNPERGKQLGDYLNRLTKGESYADAAKAAFGDLDQLDRDLRAHRNDLKAVRLSLKPLDFGQIKVTERTGLEDELFTYVMRLNIGIKESDLPLIRETVRKLRAPNMNLPLGIEVQARLAQQARDWKEELALGEQLLAQDPDSALGKYFKGHALVELVEKGAPETAYDEGRKLLAEAAKDDLTNPEPLIDFYRAYLKGDGIPPASAQNALMEAYKLLPGYAMTRMYVARDFEWRGMYDEAIHVISPLAFGSFEGTDGQKKRRAKATAEMVEKYGRAVVVDTPIEMLKRLEAKRDGKWDEKTGKIVGSEDTVADKAA